MFGTNWGEWTDKTANLTDFSEDVVKEFLRYVYTGKLEINVFTIMRILRLSSFVGLDELNDYSTRFFENG
jgi:hypothetical protein